MNGQVVKTPSWDFVLHYNQEILNRVAELMIEGDDSGNGVKIDIEQALEAARKDGWIRNTHFIELFSIQPAHEREFENTNAEDLRLKAAKKAASIEAHRIHQKAAAALKKRAQGNPALVSSKKGKAKADSKAAVKQQQGDLFGVSSFRLT